MTQSQLIKNLEAQIELDRQEIARLNSLVKVLTLFNASKVKKSKNNYESDYAEFLYG